MKEKKYTCESFEEFEKAVNEVNEYLLNERYDEMDRELDSPFRVRIKDEEQLRDNFDLYIERFEKKYPVDEKWGTLELLKYLDKCYKDVDKYQGDDLREILFEFAAEYGKALLKLPHMVLEWSENNRLVVGSKDRNVIRPRNFMLRFLFATRGNDRMPEFEEDVENAVKMLA